MDYTDKNLVKKMNDILFEDYKKQESDLKFSGSEEDFAEKSRQNKLILEKNLQKKEDLVEDQIFSGQLKWHAQNDEFDYSHNYVYEEAKETVKSLNKTAAHRIMSNMERADIADVGEKHNDKPLGDVMNKLPKASTGKKKKSEDAYLAQLKEYNPYADLNTAREYEKIDKYNEWMTKWGGIDDDGILVNPEVQGYLKDKSQTEKVMSSTSFIKTVMPFMKKFKKGWFGRRYTLDGKRIEKKPGELSVDDYNKMIMDTLTLETDEVKKGVDQKTLDENRRKKGELISKLAKELMEFSVTDDMLTDEYLSEHILKMQEYVDRLNALRVLIGYNPWYEKSFGDDAEGKLLHSLFENKLYRVSDQLNLFMDAHFAAHGMYRVGEYKTKKYGFVDEKVRKDVGKVDFNAIDREGKSEAEVQYAQLNMVEGVLKANDYREETLDQTEAPVLLFDFAKRNAEEQEDYKSRIETARKTYEKTLKTTSDNLRKLNKSNTGMADKALDEMISSTMTGFKEQSDTIYDKLKEGLDQNNQEITFAKIPYGAYDDWKGGKEIADIKKIMSDNSEMYTVYAPEIEHLYSRMYASVRLASYLSAKKASIHKEMEEDRARQESKLNFKTKSPYASVFNNYLADEVKKRTQDSLREIDQKIAFLRENSALCQMTMKYFLEGPQNQKLSDVDMTRIRGFLKKESLEHMFEVNKIDTYNNVMNDILYEVEGIIAKKDGKEKEIKRKDNAISLRDRALNIYNVRRRAKNKKILEEVIENESNSRLAKQNAIDDRNNMFIPKRLDLSVPNLKADMGEMDPEYAKKLFHMHVTEGICNDIIQDKDKKIPLAGLSRLSNYEELYKSRKIFEEIDKDTSLAHFASDCKAMIIALGQHYDVTQSMLAMHLHRSYPYFNMSRITSMTLDELSTLKTVLGKKSKALKDDPDQKASFEAIDELSEIVGYYYDAKKRMHDIGMSELSEKEVNGLSREFYEQFRIDEFKQKENRFADRKYFELREILDENKDTYKALSKETSWHYDRISKRKSSKKPLPETENEILVKCNELLAIPMDQALAMIKRVYDYTYNEEILEQDRPALLEDDIKKLIHYAYVIDCMEDIFKHASDEAYADDLFSREAVDILNKPEYENLQADVRKKLEALIPLSDAVNGYLGSMGFMYAAVNGNRWGLENKDLSNEEVKKLRERKKNYAEKGIEKFKKTSSEYEKGKTEDLIKRSKEKIFENLYKSGQKLDINDMDAWKAKITEMTKKGFSLFTKETEEQKWYRLAALEILDHWPSSFEQFYSYRMKINTGKAVAAALSAFMGEDGAKLMSEEETVKAGELSAFLSRQDTYIYHVLEENDAKELDRALEANGYDRRIFCYAMQEVEVDAANIPLNEQDRNRRKSNTEFAKLFRNFMSLSDKEKKAQIKDRSSDVSSLSDEIGSIIGSVFNAPILKGLTPDKLTMDFVGEHFEELHKLTRRISFVDMLYQKHKDLFNEDGFLRFTPVTEKALEDHFGTAKNRFFVRLVELIDAYAGIHFVAGNGSIDLDFLAEDMLASDKKQDKEAMKLRHGKAEELKQLKLLRQNHFDQAKMAMDAEVSRVRIAENTAAMYEALHYIDNIKTQGQGGGNLFSGKKRRKKAVDISDFGLLVQDANMMEQLDKHRMRSEMFEREKERVAQIKTNMQSLQEKREAVPEQLKNAYDGELEKMDQAYSMLSGIENNLYSYKAKAKVLFDTYQNCHNEDGSLSLTKTDESGKTVSLVNQYVDFHVGIAKEMAGVFDSFTKMYNENSDKILSVDFIAAQIKDKKWGSRYADYRKFNLYTGILERENKTGGKQKKSDQVKLLSDRTEGLKKELELNKKNEIAIEKQIGKTCAELDAAKKKAALLKEESAKLNQKIAADKKNKKEKYINELSKLSAEIMNQDAKIAQISGQITFLQNQKATLLIDNSRIEGSIRDCSDAGDMLTKLLQKNADIVSVFHKYVSKIEEVLRNYGIEDNGELMSEKEAKING